MTKSPQVLHLSVGSDGRRLCGRYTLLRRLGGGGRAEVWQARDDAKGTELAIKLLGPALARNEAAKLALEREYTIAARLEHPSILKIYPPQQDRETVVLPMELADGGDLLRWRGAGYLDLVPVLIQIAQALAHAHERGVVHRNLKSSNVLFDAAGRVRVTDFSAIAGEAVEANGDTGALRLYPFSASPEQLRGESPAFSDDIYGFGALAFELLTGNPPYYPQFALESVLNDPVPAFSPVHRAPVRLGALVRQMLAKKASQRPESMAEVVDELEATLNDTMTIDFDEFVELHPESPAETQRASTLMAHAQDAAPQPPVEASANERGEAGYRGFPEDKLVVENFEPARSNFGDERSAALPPQALRIDAPYTVFDRPRWARRLIIALVLLLGLVALIYWTRQQEIASDSLVLPQEPPASSQQDQPRIPAASAMREQAVIEDQTAAADPTGTRAVPGSMSTPNTATERSTSGRRPSTSDSVGSSAQSPQPRAGQTTQPRSASATQPSTLQATPRSSAAATQTAPQTTQPRSTQAPETSTARIQPPAATAQRSNSGTSSLYTKAVNAGTTALNAGRLEEARIAFELAQSFRPTGPEAVQGLQRVRTALNERAFGGMRARASEFEMQEKWTDAQREYEAMLAIDPTLGFAREGRARAEERVQLASRLQRLIDDPQSVAEDRAGAIQLIDRAREQQPYGPLLRSQVARLQTLMTGSYEPVRLTGSHQLPPAAEFYPSGARERREQGVVNVRVCVDASGVIQGTPTVQRSSGFGELDAAAIELAGAGRYAVSMRAGVAVPNCHRIDVVFALSD